MITETALIKTGGTEIFFGEGEEFIVGEKFRENIGEDAPLKISHIGKGICSKFFGKIERPTGKKRISHYELKGLFENSFIVNEIGGEIKAKGDLALAYELMRLQKNGESGFLFNNGRPNIFYAHDINGAFCTFSASWVVNGWVIVDLTGVRFLRHSSLIIVPEN